MTVEEQFAAEQYQTKAPDRPRDIAGTILLSQVIELLSKVKKIHGRIEPGKPTPNFLPRELQAMTDDLFGILKTGFGWTPNSANEGTYRVKA